MTTPCSGQITAQNIEDEFGGTGQIAINEYYGAASGVPSTGQISYADFYCKSSVITETGNLVAGYYDLIQSYGYAQANAGSLSPSTYNGQVVKILYTGFIQGNWQLQFSVGSGGMPNDGSFIDTINIKHVSGAGDPANSIFRGAGYTMNTQAAAYESTTATTWRLYLGNSYSPSISMYPGSSYLVTYTRI